MPATFAPYVPASRGSVNHSCACPPPGGTRQMIEAEGPDLVACIEESIEVRVRGTDVQRAPVHREAARVPGVTERCEHLNVADRTAHCLCLGWSGSHPQSHDYRQQRCPRHEFAYGRMPHCGVLLFGGARREGAPELEALETV